MSLNTIYDNDHVYLNIEVFGPRNVTDLRVPVSYEENRNRALLDNPSEYYLSVAKFNISGSAIPIFIMPIRTVADQIANPPPVSTGIVVPSINYTIYTVTLGHNGDVVEYPIIYTPSFIAFNTPVPNGNGIYPKDEYYYVEHQNDMLRMVNTALLGAFNDLAAPPVGSEAPYFEYENATKTIRLIAQAAFYLETVPDLTRIDIWSGDKIYDKFFSGFPFFFDPPAPPILGRFFRFRVTDTPSNYYNPPNLVPSVPPLYISTPEDYPSAPGWFDLSSIVFLSNTIPVVSEFIGVKSDDGRVIQRPILTDFTPLLINFGDQSERYVFNPTADIDYRLVNMISTAPLAKIDIQVFWKDKDGFLIPFLLNQNSLFELKLLFIKKKHISYDLKRHSYI